jgi:hypothetical protein
MFRWLSWNRTTSKEWFFSTTLERTW